MEPTRSGDEAEAGEVAALLARWGREDTGALDRALGGLAAVDPRKGRVVALRWFAGLSIEQAAETLGTSTATVERDWSVARLWLRRELAGEAGA